MVLDLSTRKLDKFDVLLASQIATRLFNQTFGHLYPPEELLAYNTQAYNHQTTLDELNNPNYRKNFPLHSFLKLFY